MQKEARVLLKVARRVVPSKTYRVLSRIEDERELCSVALYAIRTALEHKYEMLVQAIARHEKKHNTLFAAVKAARIPGKIHYFTVSSDPQACEQVLTLLQEGHKELHNGII